MEHSRTIIDILRKGNQELFHSSMIAWLMDPNKSDEHFLEDGVLRGLGKILRAKGKNELDEAVESCSIEEIKTEVRSRKSIYDIQIDLGEGKKKIILENKTKSLGTETQFEKYEHSDSLLVALGLCEISFSPTVADNYPLLIYRDILEVLDGLNVPANDFGTLTRHYMRFLERELSLLDLIVECYERGDTKRHGALRETLLKSESWTDNDVRFLNLYFLEKFKARLNSSGFFGNCQWRSSKNMISGTWLAGDLPKPYALSDDLAALQSANDAKLWVHFELQPGVFAKSLDDDAAVIQLRARVEGDKRAFLSRFQEIMGQLHERETHPRRVKQTAADFYLIRRLLSKKELVFENFERVSKEFLERFGRFNTNP